MRVIVTLECVDCRNRNYSTMKNKNKTTDRLKLKKFCRFCHKHTEHRETK